MTQYHMTEVPRLRGPCRLRPDNFTPQTRTPWGGNRIVGHYKRDLGLDLPPLATVGESWEVSVEPSLPSRLVTGEYLDTVIRADPRHWLGDHASIRFHGRLPVLVKLVDARENLSVQVHPTWEDPRLGPEESGKLECWVVLDSCAGGGLYLGFREGVTAEAARKCAIQGGRLDELMNFVPVTPGEAYVIRPGTAHVLGAGVTVVEPQLLTVGKKATTYRLWDWNRLYDQKGHVSSSGRPREMHMDRAIQVVAWDGPHGEALVASCRATARSRPEPNAKRKRLVNEQGLVVEQWLGTGSFRVEPLRSICSVTCLGGTTRLESNVGTLGLRSGESGVLPAAAGEFAVDQENSYAIAVYLEV